MKRFRKVILALLVLLLLLAGGGFLLWRSDWLAGKIRERAVAEVFKATGATATFGAFEWDWTRGVVRIDDILLRGQELPTDLPFVRIARAEISLKVLSFINPNVDLRAVKLTRPEVHIITYPDGTNNIPSRRQGRKPDEVLAEFIKLGINQIDAHQGIFTWNHEEIPFDFHGEDLEVALTLGGQLYRGKARADRAVLKLPDLRDLHFSAATDVVLESNQVTFTNLNGKMGGMQLEAAGQLKTWVKPVLTAKVKAKGPIRDVVAQFGLPVEPLGEGSAEGEVNYNAGWTFVGQLAGRNLAYRQGSVNVSGVSASANANYRFRRETGHHLDLTRVRTDAPLGVFRGTATITSTTHLIRGTIGNVRLDDAQNFLRPGLPSWGSLVFGPVVIQGDHGASRVAAHLTLAPTDGDHPLGGQVNLAYDSRTQDVGVTNTHLETHSTQLDIAGHLLTGLDVDLTTSNLAELPFVNELPIRIENGGNITFRGLVTGDLSNPAVRGQMTAAKLLVDDERVDRAAGYVQARSNRVEVERLEVIRDAQRVTGTMAASLREWQSHPNSTLQGKLTVAGVEVMPYVPDARGRVKGTVNVAGTMGDPRLDGTLEWTEAGYQAQALGTVSGRLLYGERQIEVRNGQLIMDRQPVQFSGSFTHLPDNYRSGTFQGMAKGAGLVLERFPYFRERLPGWTGQAEVDGRARGQLVNGEPTFSSLDGRLVVQQAAYEGKAIGAVTLHAKSEGSHLSLTANALVKGSSVTATSRWQLGAQMPGEGTFEIRGAKLDDFQEFLGASNGATPSSMDLRMEATGAFQGNLRAPETIKGTLKIGQLALTPRQENMTETLRRDFTLRNDGPIELTFDANGLDIKQAKLSAKDTKLSASGLLALSGQASANFRMVGEANLAVLSALKADLLATGVSTLDLTVRGSVTQPLMAGRMELRDASFFLRDVPNGLEKVNGTIFFDRSRARLENLTAQSGGGTIRVSGFIGFGGELSYQLQAQADNTRVRYPEGVSTSVNASLTLAGSAQRSLLSGSVTLLRAALTPRTDLGTLIANSSQATTSTPRVENEFLKNMQFDVRVDTALNAQLTTSLTQNVEAEVNLRLRGTPARPVLLGRTSFTQGEISFFGTKYTIDRGEVNFYNPTKIEPVINLDLQTRVRGVVVTINFAGPANKLNLSYRSDPPLQSSEILALLTVGRTPTGSVSSGANVQSPTFLQGASSALLGQAVASPITGRLQRLFGVSRVRIDPQLTGLENTAQARLTVEQQVSRDLTVTFITNLNRTQQQIVSVEWDFSREFSALAVRDENGVFGLDFFYRKRFK